MLDPGTIHDRYVIERPLGDGGMASVFQVRHTALGSVHALKVLKVTSAALKTRLQQEGRLQASLAHPNVVAVTDIIDVGGAPGLVMEYVPGGSLEGLLRERRLSVAEAEAIFRGIVAGVARAHRAGMIHRDLKPANVLMQPADGGFIPKVADFGLAKALSDDGGPQITATGVGMGTPAYMAPEQWRNAKRVDARADIFALGCVLYELSTGARAFDGDSVYEILTAVTSGRFAPPETLAPDLPSRVVAAIRGAMATDPDARIPDCATLLDVLDGRAPWAAGASGATMSASTVGATFGASTPSIPSAPPRSSPTVASPPAPSSPTLPPTGPGGVGRPPRGPSWSTVAIVAVVMAGLTALAALFAIGAVGLGAATWTAAATRPGAPLPPAPVPIPGAVPEAPPPAAPSAPTTGAPGGANVAASSTPVKIDEPAKPVTAPAAPVATRPRRDGAADTGSAPIGPPPNARVVVTGDALSVRLTDGRQVVPLDQVPPGTWIVLATFPYGYEAPAGQIVVYPGEQVTVVCDANYGACLRL